MSVTYTWELVGLSKITSGAFEDFVSRVDWRCTGTDETGVSGTFSSNTNFDPADESINNYVPYSQLTEQIVTEWVTNTVNADTDFKNYMEESIAIQINQIKSFVPASNFPWNS